MAAQAEQQTDGQTDRQTGCPGPCRQTTGTGDDRKQTDIQTERHPPTLLRLLQRRVNGDDDVAQHERRQPGRPKFVVVERERQHVGRRVLVAPLQVQRLDVLVTAQDERQLRGACFHREMSRRTYIHKPNENRQTDSPHSWILGWIDGQKSVPTAGFSLD
jgi:hypothetical protein